MSSSSSSSSNGNGDGNGGVGGAGVGGDHEGPARARLRVINGVWPEPFVEALAAQVAIDASHFAGRLAAAQALANVFQVCSMWRAVSRSDPLWSRLTRLIWGRTQRLHHHTWRDEYIYHHRTARNFRTRVSTHVRLHFDPNDVDHPNDPGTLMCRCLALSDDYLACGFADGAVRLFDLRTRIHARTFIAPLQDDSLGSFSRAVSGIIINSTHLVFATLDGNIHVAIIQGNAAPRRAQAGQLMNDGALVDFTGCREWWVGLYAGVPGRAIHIWDANNEELMFVGGTLTDPEAVMGWHTLTELTELIGRVRVTNQESAVACTSSRLMIFDLRNQGIILHEEEPMSGMMVGSLDVWNDGFMVVDGRMARVRRVGTLEEVCDSFSVRSRGRVMGSMNGGYALTCAGGVIRLWEIEVRGQYLYRFVENIGEVNAFVADERHVAAAATDMSIHLWDFGAE